SRTGGVAASPAGRRSEAGRPSRRDDRRSAAEVRDARHRATKDLKKAVRDGEKAEQKVTELERQLADPEIYGDHGRIAELAAQHGQAKKAALAAMDAWESAT